MRVKAEYKRYKEAFALYYILTDDGFCCVRKYTEDYTENWEESDLYEIEILEDADYGGNSDSPDIKEFVRTSILTLLNEFDILGGIKTDSGFALFANGSGIYVFYRCE